MEDELPVKRGRGRPKGSLNKKTLARMDDEEPVPFTLDVDFESPTSGQALGNEIMGESEPIPEPEEPASPPPPPPKLKRAASKRKPPPGSPEESEEDPPKPKRERRAKPKPAEGLPRGGAAVPQPPPVVQPPPTYLEVLTRGLRAAQATQKAQKVARYDAFFAR